LSTCLFVCSFTPQSLSRNDLTADQTSKPNVTSNKRVSVSHWRSTETHSPPAGPGTGSDLRVRWQRGRTGGTRRDVACLGRLGESHETRCDIPLSVSTDHGNAGCYCCVSCRLLVKFHWATRKYLMPDTSSAEIVTPRHTLVPRHERRRLRSGEGGTCVGAPVANVRVGTAWPKQSGQNQCK